MSRAHRQQYYGLANDLYLEDDRNPHQARAIAFRELPNLLHAAHAALAESDPDAVDFAHRVIRFLSNFGLPREIAALAARSQAAAGEVGSRLAIVNKEARKPAAAETWYRKAIEGGRQAGDILPTARALNNLAGLLRSQPGRLAEARQLAEEALAIKETLDPGVSEIWKTYAILAGIADQQGQPAQAREYRRLAREAKRNFAGTRHELRQLAPLIFAVLAACAGQEEAREVVSQNQAAMRKAGGDWSRVADALDRILAGERDTDALCESLDFDGSMIVEAILAGIEDPSSLQDLMPAGE